ncbi:MAG: hypothetical protein Q9184_008103 [Pyrenodesmia sp. 2 TL-2023]
MGRDFTKAEVQDIMKASRGKYPERAGKRALSTEERKRADEAFDRALENAMRQDEEQQQPRRKRQKRSSAGKPESAGSTSAASSIPDMQQDTGEAINDGHIAAQNRDVQDEGLYHIGQAVPGAPQPVSGIPTGSVALDHNGLPFDFEELFNDEYLYDPFLPAGVLAYPQLEAAASFSPTRPLHSPEQAARPTAPNLNEPPSTIDCREVSPTTGAQLQVVGTAIEMTREQLSHMLHGITGSHQAIPHIATGQSYSAAYETLTAILQSAWITSGYEGPCPTLPAVTAWPGNFPQLDRTRPYGGLQMADSY